MPRLILLNGMPAVGKTTLARRYGDEHPMTFVLDLDTIRGLLGGWRTDPIQAGLLARAASLALAGEHLRSGHDVVLPQYLGRPAFIEQAHQLARDAGAEFHEFVLTDDRDELLRRFTERTSAGTEAGHVEAGWLLSQSGGDRAFMAMYDRLLLILSSRPAAQVLHCPEGALDEVYAHCSPGWLDLRPGYRAYRRAMRISDAATSTGIPASTLRYYETIGLLAPNRSDAGYRDYDEATLQRWRAIAAAKRVGLGLEDIAWLLAACDSGSCLHTKQTLRPRLLARLANTHRDARDVLARAESLQATLAHVDTLPDSDEPCSPDCALPAPVPAQVIDDPAPVCTLGERERGARTARWRALLGEATRTPLADGVRFELSPDRAAAVAELVVAEHSCCPSLELRLTVGGSGVQLDVHAPHAAMQLMTEVLAVAG